jgi:glyoxylase-like metal-dependent hydrolase (beta-lactamase superfamily II)
LEEIAYNIFIETSYPGVVVAAWRLKHGLLIVDAPFRIEDQQAWQSRLNKFDIDQHKVLVMLDTHMDRTLGIRGMAINVLSHNRAVEILENRPTTARGQVLDAGADWEFYDLPVSIEWAVPDITYSDKLSIFWDEAPIVLTHQPGAHLAGSWLWHDAKKILFVGDSVIVNQPPFLAWADLDYWLAELHWLNSERFKGYKIVSGRNGVVKVGAINKLIGFLTHVNHLISDLVGKDNLYEKIVAAVPGLMKDFSFRNEFTEIYKNRMIWGLNQYMQRHYPESNQPQTGDDE